MQGRKAYHTGSSLGTNRLESSGNFGKRSLCNEVSLLVSTIVLLFLNLFCLYKQVFCVFNILFCS